MGAVQAGLCGSDRSLLPPYAAKLLDRGLHKWVIAVTAAPGAVLEMIDAGGAQFARFPPDSATGNFTKVVQRVPVKLVLDKPGLDEVGDRLRPGPSAVVDVRVR